MKSIKQLLEDLNDVRYAIRTAQDKGLPIIVELRQQEQDIKERIKKLSEDDNA